MNKSDDISVTYVPDFLHCITRSLGLPRSGENCCRSLSEGQANHVLLVCGEHFGGIDVLAFHQSSPLQMYSYT